MAETQEKARRWVLSRASAPSASKGKHVGPWQVKEPGDDGGLLELSWERVEVAEVSALRKEWEAELLDNLQRWTLGRDLPEGVEPDSLGALVKFADILAALSEGDADG